MAYMSEGEAYRGIWKVIRHNLYYNDLVNIIELSKAMSDSLGEITGDLGEFALRHRERLHLAEYQALRMRHFEEYRQAQEELDAFMGRVPAIEASFRLASRAYLGHIGEAFTQIDILERYGGEIFSSNTIATSAPLAQSKLGRLRLPDFDVMIGGGAHVDRGQG